MKSYLINTPNHSLPYSGVRVLHYLYDELTKRGCDVLLHTPPPFNYKYNSTNHLYGVNLNNYIVVYPEIVKGNPFNAKYVARWVLNAPGLLGGDKVYDEKEKVFVFNPEHLNLCKNANLLTIPFIDKDLFKDEKLEKEYDLFWVGKGTNTNPDLTKGLKEITYNWPTPRTELANVLKKCKVLYSFDSLSAVNDEALACGAKVILVNGFFKKEYTKIYEKVIENFEEQIKNFIELTQNMSAGCR